MMIAEPKFCSPTTTEKTLHTLDQDIHNVLNADILIDIKAKQSEVTLKRFNIPSTLTQTLAMQTNGILSEVDILDSIPASMHHKAKWILDHFERGATVSNNDKGELIVKSVPVPNTNIIGLLDSMLKKISIQRVDQKKATHRWQKSISSENGQSADQILRR